MNFPLLIPPSAASSNQAPWQLRRQRQELFVHVSARSEEAAEGWEPRSGWENDRKTLDLMGVSWDLTINNNEDFWD